MNKEEIEKYIAESSGAIKAFMDAYLETAHRASEAITAMGRAMSEALAPAFEKLGVLMMDEQERKKQKYITRYYRRGERIKKKR